MPADANVLSHEQKTLLVTAGLLRDEGLDHYAAEIESLVLDTQALHLETCEAMELLLARVRPIEHALMDMGAEDTGHEIRACRERIAQEIDRAKGDGEGAKHVSFHYFRSPFADLKLPGDED